MLNFRVVLICLLPLLTPIATAAPSSTPSSNATLKDLAAPRFWGTALNTISLFNDSKYTELAGTQFSIFTPENEMKWESIEPFQNVFNFGPADEIVNFAESVGAKVRGHNFLWEQQLLPWVNESLSATELDRALKNHIFTVMDHYKGRLFAWDVINEAISDTPNATFRDDIWLHKFGEDALPKALQYAREADPTPKLYINDFGIEAINNKSNSLFEVVKSFVEDGVPLDAVGFQAHLTLGQVPSTFQENLQRFADLGLDVAITELDINMGGAPNDTALAQQAEDYHTVVSACLAIERCVSITVWGISDDVSWLGPTGNALPFDGNKNPKPAFSGVADALTGQ